MRDFSGLTAKEVNSKTAKTQRDATNRAFYSFFNGDKTTEKSSVSPKDLRHAYALITAKKYAEDSAFTAFFSLVLGHTETDSATATSYMTLRVDL